MTFPPDIISGRPFAYQWHCISQVAPELPAEWATPISPCSYRKLFEVKFCRLWDWHDQSADTLLRSRWNHMKIGRRWAHQRSVRLGTSVRDFECSASGANEQIFKYLKSLDWRTRTSQPWPSCTFSTKWSRGLRKALRPIFTWMISFRSIIVVGARSGFMEVTFQALWLKLG